MPGPNPNPNGGTVTTVTPIKGVLNSSIIRWSAISQTAHIVGAVVTTWIAAHPDELRELANAVATAVVPPAVYPAVVGAIGLMTGWKAMRDRYMKPDIVELPQLTVPGAPNTEASRLSVRTPPSRVD